MADVDIIKAADHVTSPTPVSGGRLLDDETIDRLASEAEAGIDLNRLRAGGRPLMGSAAARVVPVRLDPELDEALRQRAVQDDSTTGAVILDALRAWLTPA